MDRKARALIRCRYVLLWVSDLEQTHYNTVLFKRNCVRQGYKTLNTTFHISGSSEAEAMGCVLCRRYFLNTIFVLSHLYSENPEGIQVYAQ